MGPEEQKEEMRICTPVSVEVDMDKFRKRCLVREKSLVKIIDDQRAMIVKLGRQLTGMRRYLATKWKDSVLGDEEDWESFDDLDKKLPMVNQELGMYSEETRKRVREKENEEGDGEKKRRSKMFSSKFETRVLDIVPKVDKESESNKLKLSLFAKSR